jgi:hypothetical protein
LSSATGKNIGARDDTVRNQAGRTTHPFGHSFGVRVRHTVCVSHGRTLHLAVSHEGGAALIEYLVTSLR